MSHEKLIQDAAKAIDIYGEDALEAHAEKQKYITDLVNDFKATTPRYSRAEALEVHNRLQRFTLDELKLLHSGIANKN